MTRKYNFSIATNLVRSEHSEIVEIHLDDDLTEDEIDAQVTEIYTEWLFENNQGGFSQI